MVPIISWIIGILVIAVGVSLPIIFLGRSHTTPLLTI